MSNNGPASSTSGPHKHNILNRLDPRVDHKNKLPAPAPSQPPITRGPVAEDSTTPTQPTGPTLDPRVDLPASAKPAEGPIGPAQTTPPQALAVPQHDGTSQASHSPKSSGESDSSWTLASLTGKSSDKSSEPVAHKASSGLASGPTDGHALAAADHDIKGRAQQDHDEVEVKDLGWHTDPAKVSAPLVGRLPNEELWTLIRRFNKQLYHVKATDEMPPGGLDLNIADEEEFSPDKLRSNVERLYMTVIIGMASFGKHVQRIRSWNEARRTTAFCTAYFVAWIFDFITPLMLATLITLIAYPPSRAILFPPAPLALMDASTGGMKKPKAGMLGSHDSMTGAPEKHQGEAVEQEAHNFVSGLASIGASSATGKEPESRTLDEAGGVDHAMPDPSSIANGASDAHQAAHGGDPNKAKDKTKQPMEDAMWSKMRPVMHIIADIADGWERMGNALSPTPPFPANKVRLRLAGIVAALFLVSLVTNSYMFVKGATFGIGFGFFGDPINTRALKLLNEKFPNWQKLLEIRNTILKGVPTNAQLTLILLRIGEVNHAPLPPPPVGDGSAPSNKPKKLSAEDVPMTDSNGELQDAINPTQSDDHDAHGQEKQTDKSKPAKGGKIMSLFKGTTKTVISTTLGTDRLKAATGNASARNRLGVLPSRDSPPDDSGPVDFKARYKGDKGYVYISTAATTPCLSFTRDAASVERGNKETIKPVWSVAINDIKELKKIGGLGWKTKLVVGWAMEQELADGLTIVTRSGEAWRLTAVPLREELFNRLVSMGGQKWESW